MNSTDLQQQIALTLLCGVGRRKMRHILAELGSVEAFFQEKKHKLLKIKGLGETLLSRIDREQALREAEPFAEYFLKKNFRSYFFLSADFPHRLAQCEDAPLLLFGSGNMDFNKPRVVAIVGTRKASEYGKKLCEELIASFAGKDIVVVSGLAYGIDIQAHQLCLKYGIQTIGVLGHGLDRIYPSVHRNTATRMLENGGLLTEFLPGTKPDRENFPMRNRIVAGMCDATVVIESGEKGGSLITAELANDYNRDVFAFPGDIERESSRGCNRLIQQNQAHLITGSEDFARIMGWEENSAPVPAQRHLFGQLAPDETSLVNTLHEHGETSIDLLALRTNLPVSKVSAVLLGLEFRAVVRSLPGKRFVLI